MLPKKRFVHNINIVIPIVGRGWASGLNVKKIIVGALIREMGDNPYICYNPNGNHESEMIEPLEIYIGKCFGNVLILKQ